MSEYDDMSIDELIEYPVRTAATAGKIGRELGRRRLIRDTYLDISEAMAEAGEYIATYAPVEPGTTNADILAGTAYQVIGSLASDDQFDSPEVQRALDWFSRYDDSTGVTEDLLPWGPPLPSNATTEGGE